MKIAILGYGTVGKSLDELLRSHDTGIEVKKILRRTGKAEGPRMTESLEEILKDPEITAVAEVLSGVEPAAEYIRRALSAGKHVVSANKAALASDLPGLMSLAKASGVSLLFEASCGGGIPWLESIKKARLFDEISSLKGILNGTGNYILDAMERQGLDFSQVLEKAQALGAKVIALSDSNGYILDPEGIRLSVVKEIKEVRRGRIREYLEAVPTASYHEGKGIWSIPCDIALPCATQNELTLEDAKLLQKNGCFAVAEGANMPSTLEATEFFVENGFLYMPAKAANAGGVATSALEMSQNSERLSWSFEEVDAKLKSIMKDIYQKTADAAKRCGAEGNFVMGANVAGFEKVAQAMMAQGIC